MALWKGIPGYEDRYLVSDEGEIYSLPKIVKCSRLQHRKGKYLKPGKRGNKGLKYEFVYLVDNDGKGKRESVHRLVALAFLDNPDGLPEVNHKDENPLNNRADNLEWCNRQYNIEYSKAKAVNQYDDNGFLAKYKSIAYASKMTGIKRRSIQNALCGWSQRAGGYIWKYANKGDNEI